MPTLRSAARRVARTTCAAACAALLAAPPLRAAAAQTTRTLTACTPDALAVCTELRLTAGPSLFEIGLRTLGATGAPSTPMALYNLVLGTGAATVGTPATTTLAPVALGGATVTDPSAWQVFDTGDALFLSALTNRGVGGCVTGADMGSFGQAATTCGAGQFVTFDFVPTRAFDLTRFRITDLEAVLLTSALPGASCGSPAAPCRIVAPPPPPPTTVPEPGTPALLAAGLLAVAGVVRRRRSSAGDRTGP